MTSTPTSTPTPDPDELPPGRSVAIEQAKGMIILVHGVDETTAFRMLARRSMDTHEKLRDVAADVVAGRLPVWHLPTIEDPS